MSSPIARISFPFIILALGVIAFSPLLTGQFVYDDLPTIRDNRFIRTPGAALRLYGRAEIEPSGYFRGHYRPLLMSTFALNYALSPVEEGRPAAWVFKATNLALHILNGLLLLLLLRGLARSWWPDGQTAIRRILMLHLPVLLFLLHPAQTIGIGFVWKRSGLLAATLMLGAMNALVAGHRAREEGRTDSLWSGAILFLFGGALLVKESAVVLPGLLLLVELVLVKSRPQPEALPFWRRPVFHRHAQLWALAALYTLFWLNALRPSLHNAMGGLSWKVYLAQQLGGALPRYLGLALFPFGLSIEHARPELQSLGSGATIAGAFGLFAIIICGVWLLLSGRNRAAGLGLLLMLMPLAPSSSFHPLPLAVDHHRMYLPLAGLGIALGGALAGWTWLSAPGRLNPVRIGVGCLALLLAGGSFHRSLVWSDPVRLWRDAAAKAPARSTVWINLAQACHEARDPRCREAALRRAAAMKSEGGLGRALLGELLYQTGRRGQGLRVARSALAIAGADRRPRLIYGRMLLREGQPRKAKPHLRSFVRAHPGDLEGRLLMVEVSSRLRDPASLARHGVAAIRMGHHKPDLMLAVSDAFLALGRVRAGAHYLRAAMFRRREDPRLYIKLAAVFRLQGKLKLAQGALNRGRKRFPRFKQFAFFRAGLLVDQGKSAKAEALLNRLLESHPREPSLLANLATLRARQGRRREAIRLLRKLARISPKAPGLQARLQALIRAAASAPETSPPAAPRGAPLSRPPPGAVSPDASPKKPR